MNARGLSGATKDDESAQTAFRPDVLDPGAGTNALTHALSARLEGDEKVRRIAVGDASLPSEYFDILAIRLRAHQHDGRFLHSTVAELALPFDAHARHLVCRLDGRIIGCVRLNHVDGDPGRSQYVAWGRHELPDWLWQAGFIEAGAGAIEPEHQMSGFFLIMMQHAVRVARELGYRFVVGACEDDRVAMYQRMGFFLLEAREVEPKPGWRFISRVIVLDMDGLLSSPPQGKWVATMAAIVSSVDAVIGSGHVTGIHS
jgi:predicted N-acetyltransferase YhbS